MSDQELVKSCLKGNVRSQKHLYEVYSGNMMTIARSFALDNQEAKDILQESFTKIFKNLDKFRFESSLKSWIRSIVVNTAIKYIRYRKNRIIQNSEWIQEPLVFPEVLSQLEEETLLSLVKKLPSGYRAVFMLYVIEDKKHAEISKLLHISESTSRSQLVKARRMLQRMIAKHYRIAL